MRKPKYQNRQLVPIDLGDLEGLTDDPWISAADAILPDDTDTLSDDARRRLAALRRPMRIARTPHARKADPQD